MKDFMYEYGGLMIAFLLGMGFVSCFAFIFNFLARDTFNIGTIKEPITMEFDKTNRPGFEYVDSDGNPYDYYDDMHDIEGYEDVKGDEQLGW